MNKKGVLAVSALIVGVSIFWWSAHHWEVIFVEGQHLVYRLFLHKPTPHLSQIETKEITAPSLGSSTRKVAVYLPPLYHQNNNKRYPVLYLLHGDPGTYEDWLINADIQTILDDLIGANKIPPMIVIMPDGNGPVIPAGQYVDASVVNQHLETYLVKDIVDFVDSTYRTIVDRQSRALGGNSSGAFGAANLGFKHNNEFANLLIMSGYFDLDKEKSRFFGSDQNKYLENTPMKYLVNLSLNPQTFVYLSVGDEDKPEWLEQNKEVANLLATKKIPHELNIVHGEHNWDVWRQEVATGLVQMSKYLKTK